MPYNRNRQERGQVNRNGDNRHPQDRNGSMAFCCMPGGCDTGYEEPIYVNDPGDAVKVFCNNENCTVGNWMHGSCFQLWEQQVLSYLRSCGRARSWSEKQRLQNLWTKKGYDLAYKACDCKCGRGHLRKDLDYTPAARPEEKKQRKHKNKHQKGLPSLQKPAVAATNVNPPPTPGINVTANATVAAAAGGGLNNTNNGTSRPQLRVRTSSFSSTGSSPPSSAGTPPLTPVGAATGTTKKFEFFADVEQAAAGNIFRRRADFSAFSVLPRHQQNPYHIKMEDEGPYGNDETRCFVLSNLSSQQVTAVRCVVCNCELPVFDRYPLIDGTFFLSPLRYNSDLQVLSDHKMSYLNSVCMRCLEGSKRQLRCMGCKRQWHGTTLVLGTMYSYDIFAAQPCCGHRTSCKSCRRAIIDPENGFAFFSEYSHPIECPYCKRRDYHFVKPLNEAFYIKQPI